MLFDSLHYEQLWLFADIIYMTVMFVDTLYRLPGMDIKDCPTARDNWKLLSDNWTSHSTCQTGQVKFEPSLC